MMSRVYLRDCGAVKVREPLFLPQVTHRACSHQAKNYKPKAKQAPTTHGVVHVHTNMMTQKEFVSRLNADGQWVNKP